MEDHISEEFEKYCERRVAIEMTESRAYYQRVREINFDFRGFDSPCYDKAEYEKLLNELIEFEQITAALDSMKFFYGEISLTALHAKNLPIAISYAKAGLKVCAQDADQSEKPLYLMNLCYAALMLGSSLVASEYFKQANPDDTPVFEVKPQISSDDEVRAYIKQIPDLTQTLHFLLDDSAKGYPEFLVDKMPKM